MAINYNINADIIDIRVDKPHSGDVFLVDTNVWYWMTYPRASSTLSYQTTDYPTYISEALSSKSRLLRCGLSLAELAHIIEKNELEIYKRSFGRVSTKEYRHNHQQERKNVVAQINAAWGQVKSMASPLEGMTIDESTTDSALNLLKTETLDGYDLFILDSLIKTGIVQIITDDGDFATVPRIKVFTANQRVIDSAKSQGKLVTR